MMMLKQWQWAVAAAMLLFATSAVRAEESVPRRTALDEYLEKPDPSYQWKIAKTLKGDGETTFVIDLVSQNWRSEGEVHRTEWRHWLLVTRPDVIESDKAFLYISGGSNGQPAPDKPGSLGPAMAKATHSVVAELGQVPNQPLKFIVDDDKPRWEDDLIAWTWNKVIETGDEGWAARLPMVKSAHRAMDAIEELMAGAEGGEVEINGFVVAGGSKRGWTTWLTGATDERVVGIVPIVIDVLNVAKSMSHHFRAYGFWAPSVGDYVRHGITAKMNTPEIAKLYQLVDPYFYRDRLTMPKYMVSATGDQFFLPDSSKFYFDDLVGEKYLRYLSNSDHSTGGTDAIESITAYYDAIINDRPRPEFDWEFTEGGAIEVATKDKPDQVLLWQATNPKARDFRVDTIGRAYKSTELSDQGGGKYSANVSAPETGFTAFYIELVYNNRGGPFPMKFTTAVRVVPDVLPFGDKEVK